MGVRTEADERLDSARERIQGAIEDLSEIVIRRCWGHDEFTSTAQKNILKAHQEMMALRHRLEHLSEEIP
jgi:predicted  nucleic acid-binding Zn-ribbon protein